MYHCYFLINYIGPPKVFFLSFGFLFKKFAHHWYRGCLLPKSHCMHSRVWYGNKSLEDHEICEWWNTSNLGANGSSSYMSFCFYKYRISNLNSCNKGKVFLLQARCGPEGG